MQMSENEPAETTESNTDGLALRIQADLDAHPEASGLAPTDALKHFFAMDLSFGQPQPSDRTIIKR